VLVPFCGWHDVHTQIRSAHSDTAADTLLRGVLHVQYIADNGGAYPEAFYPYKGAHLSPRAENLSLELHQRESRSIVRGKAVGQHSIACR
jgi:hypothetical protein